MKRNVLLLFLWVLGIVVNIGCTSKPRGETKFKDSIVVFITIEQPKLIRNIRV